MIAILGLLAKAFHVGSTAHTAVDVARKLRRKKKRRKKRKSTSTITLEK